ncbi:MAG: glutamate-1-semialdehyde 2,1-aminomutase [Bacillota bacterium]|jgi:glutamate-1-semialdehyde 2,1-aminomutase
MDKTAEKQALLQRSREIMVGGVNSPVRAFGDVDCDPVIVTEAKGARVTDLGGESYIDYVCSYGPLIFGHAPEFLLTAVEKALHRGTTYGFTTPSEVELAELICASYPGCDKIRMVNSGTEATMSAIRAARGFTGRDKILKFEGCYHGHSDSLLVKSGSGLLTQNVPTSKGIVRELIEKTLVCPYNDADALAKMIDENKGEIACVIIEPIAGNMGVLPPDDGYLRKVRELTEKDDIILIFDEVITGFRVDYRSAAGLFDIVPDMVCFGKIIGGGLPVGAYGGRNEIMEMVAPLGPVYQGGTLSGNPLAMAAGIANLTKLRDEPEVYDRLSAAAAFLDKEITALCGQYGIPAVTSRFKGMFCLFFSEKPVRSYADVMACDTELYKAFFEGMVKEGVLLAPSQFEAWFPSAAHDQAVLDRTVEAVKNVFKKLRK